MEKSKYKIGKYTPGSGIKIIDERKIKNIEIALILPWNITNHLINKLSKKNKLVYTSIQKVIKNINAKKLKYNFKDKRGGIIDIFVNSPKDHCTIVTFNKNAIRGIIFIKKAHNIPLY